MLKVFDFDISTSWILMLRCLTVGNHLSQLIMKLGWTSFTYVTLFSPTDRIRAPFNLFCFSFSLVDAVQPGRKKQPLARSQQGQKKIILLFPEMRVTRKIFTRTAASFFKFFYRRYSLFFICFFCFFWFLFFVVIVSCFLNLKMYILIPNCFNWLFYTVSYFLCKFVTNLFDIKID